MDVFQRCGACGTPHSVSTLPLYRRLLYATAVVLGVMGAAEGIARGIWSPEAVAINPSLAYLADHPTLFWTLRPGLSDYVTVDGFTLTSNRLGLRDDPISDPAPAARVLSMGESTTWGHGVEAEQTYSQRIERQLQADGWDAEVINAGIGAWTIWQSYVFLAEHGAALAPDVVMLYHLHNDQLPRGVADENNHLYQVPHTDRQLHERRRPYRRPLALLYQSRLYLALRNHMLALPDLPEASDTMEPVAVGEVRVPMADRRQALDGIAAICQSIGARLVVIMPVYRGHTGRDRVLVEFAFSSAARYANLPVSKHEAGVPDAGFYQDPIHPTAEGHRHIASWLYPIVEAELRQNPDSARSAPTPREGRSQSCTSTPIQHADLSSSEGLQTQDRIKTSAYVSFSGTVSCEGCAAPLVLRARPFVPPDQPSDDKVRYTALRMTCPGPFSIALPVSTESIALEVVVDRDGDGLLSAGERSIVLSEGGQLIADQSRTGLRLDVTAPVSAPDAPASP